MFYDTSKVLFYNFVCMMNLKTHKRLLFEYYNSTFSKSTASDPSVSKGERASNDI